MKTICGAVHSKHLSALLCAYDLLIAAALAFHSAAANFRGDSFEIFDRLTRLPCETDRCESLLCAILPIRFVVMFASL